jgi:hypothetical protein
MQDNWIIATSVLLSLSNSLTAQVNLVPNGGFEVVDSCPYSAGQIKFAPPWFPSTQCTPDLFHECGSSYYSIPANLNNCIVEPSQGVGMARILVYGQFEYIGVKLIDSLRVNRKYIFKMDILKNCGPFGSVGSVGVIATTDSLVNMSLLFQSFNLTPTINHDSTIYFNDFINWVNYQDTITAVGGELFITIGNFYSSENTPYDSLPDDWTFQSVILIDNISLTQLDTATSVVEEVNAGLQLAPNPTLGKVAISHNGKRGLKSVAVTDLSGKLQQFYGPVREVDVGGLSNGIYLVVMEFEGGVKTVRKLVVQRE